MPGLAHPEKSCAPADVGVDVLVNDAWTVCRNMCLRPGEWRSTPGQRPRGRGGSGRDAGEHMDVEREPNPGQGRMGGSAGALRGRYPCTRLVGSAVPGERLGVIRQSLSHAKVRHRHVLDVSRPNMAVEGTTLGQEVDDV